MTAHSEPASPRQLPIVEYEGKRWFLDERLRQLRNIDNPHDYRDLDKDELFVFKHLSILKRIIAAGAGGENDDEIP